MIPGFVQLLIWVVLLLVMALAVYAEVALAPLLAVIALWLVVLLVTALWLRRWQPVRVERCALQTAAVGKPFVMSLMLHNLTAKPLQVRVADSYPADFSSDYWQQVLALPAHGAAELRYTAVPQRRSVAQFGGVDVCCGSPWGLWQRVLHLSADFRVRVYPQFRQVGRNAGLRTRSAMMQMPEKRELRNGGEEEFAQLRDYLPGDSLRRLDHKAFARLGKPLTRQYLQTSQQPIVLLLDSSLRMQGEYRGQPVFEAALNAVSLLAQMALEGGDTLGLGCFSGQLLRWIPPARGKAQYAKVMAACAEVQADDGAVNFVELAAQLRRRLTRSSLLLVLMSVQASDAPDLRRALALLRRRHQVVVINVWPPFLAETEVVVDVVSAARAGAQALFASELMAVLNALRAQGVDLLSVPAAEIRVALLNRYLAYRAPA